MHPCVLRSTFTNSAINVSVYSLWNCSGLKSKRRCGWGSLFEVYLGQVILLVRSVWPRGCVAGVIWWRHSFPSLDTGIGCRWWYLGLWMGTLVFTSRIRMGCSQGFSFETPKRGFCIINRDWTGFQFSVFLQDFCAPVQARYVFARSALWGSFVLLKTSEESIHHAKNVTGRMTQMVTSISRRVTF